MSFRHQGWFRLPRPNDGRKKQEKKQKFTENWIFLRKLILGCFSAFYNWRSVAVAWSILCHFTRRLCDVWCKVFGFDLKICFLFCNLGKMSGHFYWNLFKIRAISFAFIKILRYILYCMFVHLIYSKIICQTCGY